MATVEFKSTIDVELVQHAGDDGVLAHAAMVSTRGARQGKDVSDDKINGILKTLITKRHGTPFEHASMTFRFHGPIKVLREWHRHRIGWSYNEESGRYKQLEPLFYVPPPERPLIEAPDFKPMSPVFVPAPPELYHEIVEDMKIGYRHSYDRYERLLLKKVDKGVARDVLGVGIYTSQYATCNPRSLMSFLELRTNRPDAGRPSKPLWEIERAALQMEAYFAHLFPMTYTHWLSARRMAP